MESGTSLCGRWVWCLGCDLHVVGAVIVNQELLEEWGRWCVAAMLCECADNQRHLNPRHSWSVMDSPGVRLYGICDILDITVYGITPSAQAMFRCMERRMWEERPDKELNDYSYWWPRTKDGWRARAEFCWRMAELCEQELTGYEPERGAP